MAQNNSQTTALLIVAIVAIVGIVGLIKPMGPSTGMEEITGFDTSHNITEKIEINCTTWIAVIGDTILDLGSGFVEQGAEYALVYTNGTTNVNWGGAATIYENITIENKGNNNVNLTLELWNDTYNFLGTAGNSISVAAAEGEAGSCVGTLLSNWTALALNTTVVLCDNFTWPSANDEIVFYDFLNISKDTPPGYYAFNKEIKAVEVFCAKGEEEEEYEQTYHFVSDNGGNIYEWVNIKWNPLAVDDTWNIRTVSSGAIGLAWDLAFMTYELDLNYSDYELWAINRTDLTRVYRFNADNVVGAIYENNGAYTLGGVGGGLCLANWGGAETLEAIAWGNDGNFYVASYNPAGAGSAWVRQFSFNPVTHNFLCTKQFNAGAINGYTWPIDGIAPSNLTHMWVYEFAAFGLPPGIGEIRSFDVITGAENFYSSPLNVSYRGLAEDYYIPETILWGTDTYITGNHSACHYTLANPPVKYSVDVFGANTPVGTTSSIIERELVCGDSYPLCNGNCPVGYLCTEVAELCICMPT